MALETLTSSTTWLKLKEGRFYLSTDKDCTQPYKSVTGYLTGMSFRKEKFDGKEFEKLYISVQDDTESYTFGVSTVGKAWSMLICFLKNADISEPIKFEPAIVKEKYMKDGKQEEKSVTLIFVKQNGENVSSYYSKDSGNSLPQWEKVQVGRNTVWVKDAWEDALRADVEEIVARAKGNVVSPTKKDSSEPAPQEESFDSDVPF